MGATKSITAAQDTAQGTLGSEQGATTYAIPQIPVPDAFKMRFAGDRLTDISPVVSISELSQRSKYAPGQASKAPSSQYLAAASAPLA